MGELTTSRRLLPYPKPQGLVGAGPADMRELGEAAEGLNEGYADYTQFGAVTGVRAATSWEPIGTSLEVNSTSGLVTTAAQFGRFAWLPDPVLATGSAVMCLANAPVGSLSIQPAVLPAEGKLRAYHVELAAQYWGGPPTYSIKEDSAGDKALGELAAAEARGKAGDAPASGKVIFSWIVIANEGGTYVRKARGYRAAEAGPTGPGSPKKAATGLQVAPEATGLNASTSGEAESSRGAVVTLEIELNAEVSTTLKVLVGATVIAEPSLGSGESGETITMQFWLPAHTPWSWTKAGGSKVTVRYSYKRV